MTSITLEAAQATLPELIQQLLPGEEVIITNGGLPVAHVKKAERISWPCAFGCYQTSGFNMAPDFDAPLEEFREYME